MSQNDTHLTILTNPEAVIMSGTAKIRALNDALESQNTIIEQYSSREKQDRTVKTDLYMTLSQISKVLNENPSGVEILAFPNMRSDELARLKPHEITESIKQWCSVAAGALRDNRRELGELYAELGVASIDANLERFNKLRVQANQAGIAASFRGPTAEESLPARPKTPETPVASSGLAGIGVVPVPSPPDSSDGARPKPTAAKKSAASKTTTLDSLLGGTGRTTPAANKKK